MVIVHRFVGESSPTNNYDTPNNINYLKPHESNIKHSNGFSHVIERTNNNKKDMLKTIWIILTIYIWAKKLSKEFKTNKMYFDFFLIQKKNEPLYPWFGIEKNKN
jgi:hypothetical protein